MDCSWVCRFGERSGGRGAVWFGVAFVQCLTTRSANPLEALAPAARFIDHSPDQFALVCPGTLGGGPSLLGQLFWVSQPPAFYVGRE